MFCLLIAPTVFVTRAAFRILFKLTGFQARAGHQADVVPKRTNQSMYRETGDDDDNKPPATDCTAGSSAVPTPADRFAWHWCATRPIGEWLVALVLLLASNGPKVLTPPPPRQTGQRLVRSARHVALLGSGLVQFRPATGTRLPPGRRWSRRRRASS